MDLDIPRQPRHVSVKEAVLPFGRFPRADALLGPEMKSTGEVMGVASDYPAAFGKAQAAAGAELPASGTVFISVTDGDKSAATQLAAGFHDMGFRVVATGGTASVIRRMGVPVERILKLSEGSPNVVERIEAGEVDLVINTPTGSGARADGYEIRRAAIGRGIPCITTMSGASAAQRAIRAARAGETSVISLQELHGLLDAARCRAPRRRVLPRGGGARRLSEPRTLAPPERRVATVSGVERLGAYELITALDRFGPTNPRPGQFYMLATASHWGGVGDERPYLPRAFSYARAVVESDGLALSFLLEEVGPGTERLSELSPDEGLALSAHSAWASAPPAAGTRPILVGGGIGAAPLLCWREELCAPDGASGPPRSCSASAARRMPRRRHCSAPAPQVVTDDGSVGRQALVTELLASELDGDARATVYACGPPRMLEAVRALCAERGVSAQLAMESGMACGFGACFGCVVPTRNGYVRLCVDGPVIEADLLDTALVAGAEH